MTGCFVVVYDSHSGKLKKKQRIAKSSYKTKLWKNSICAAGYSVPKALLRLPSGHLSAVLSFYEKYSLGCSSGHNCSQNCQPDGTF